MVILSFSSLRAAAGENLLQNPAFEVVTGSMPAHWSLFVEPHPGAEARLDAGTGGGGYAVMVYNPNPYEKDPANNWSQNVTAPLAGSTVRLAGSIKTENATEAALWLQCWSKPWRLLSFATTSAAMPVHGTCDWTPVSVEAEVPQETQVVVVRCVLLGQGCAWFDDISLEKQGSVAAAVAGGGPAAPANSRARSDAHREVTDNLVEANMVLATTVQELHDANEALTAQVRALAEEVDALRLQVQALTPHAEAQPEAPSGTAAHVPPLVPHGDDPEEMAEW